MCSLSSASPLNDLPPEIYSIIAAHLPLHSAPSTLLSLALVNHRISEIVLPLVYSCLIPKNKTNLKLIQRLLDEPSLRQKVREIHVVTDATMTGLAELIDMNSLPYIHTLGLDLGYGFRLRSDFWNNVKKNCPRLRRLVLRNIDDYDNSPWVRVDCGSDLDVTSLTLYFCTLTNRQNQDKVFKNINSLSANLLSLDLAPIHHGTSISPLLAMTFPKLRSLRFNSFVAENAQSIAFLERHPSLEFLAIINPDKAPLWFSRDSVLPQRILPNLKHLKAHFSDVEFLAPILGQLISLTVYESIDRQIPYVLPDGLPNLKSLFVSQNPSYSERNAYMEGPLWCETEDGEFEAKATELTRREEITNGYIHSIARGAPNLEEIGFRSYFLRGEKIAKFAPQIAYLSKIRRFYYTEWGFPNVDSYISRARTLAEVCDQLTMVVCMSSFRNDCVARISRTGSGEIRSIDTSVVGYGMQIGREDEAFPENEIY